MIEDNSRSLVIPEDNYDKLLTDLHQIIETGRGRAAIAINSEVVSTYWQIGERIVVEEQLGMDRAAYGEQILAKLGRALSLEFGRGFAEGSLRNMRQFYHISNSLRSAERIDLDTLSHSHALT